MTYSDQRNAQRYTKDNWIYSLPDYPRRRWHICDKASKVESPHRNKKLKRTIRSTLKSANHRQGCCIARVRYSSA